MPVMKTGIYFSSGRRDKIRAMPDFIFPICSGFPLVPSGKRISEYFPEWVVLRVLFSFSSDEKGVDEVIAESGLKPGSSEVIFRGYGFYFPQKVAG